MIIIKRSWTENHSSTVPVASVTLLNISSQNGMTEAREGSITLICVTSPSNPAPSVSWYKQGQQITSGISNTPEQKPDGLTVTTSSLSLTVSRSDRGHSVYCKASIPGQTTPVKSNTGILDVWCTCGFLSFYYESVLTNFPGHIAPAMFNNGSIDSSCQYDRVSLRYYKSS